MSAVFTTGVAAAFTIMIVPIGMIIDSIIGSYWTYSPWKLANYGIEFLTGAIVIKDFIIPAIISGLFIILFIELGIFRDKAKLAQDKI